MKKEFNIDDLLIEKSTGLIFKVENKQNCGNGFEYYLVGDNDNKMFAHDENLFIKVNAQGIYIRPTENFEQVESDPRHFASEFLSQSDLYGDEYYKMEDALANYLNGQDYVLPTLSKNTIFIKGAINSVLKSLLNDHSLITKEEEKKSEIKRLAFSQIKSIVEDEIPSNEVIINAICEAISYIRYLAIWSDEHDFTDEAACFEEFIDNEYNDEEARNCYNSIVISDIVRVSNEK